MATRTDGSTPSHSASLPTQTAPTPPGAAPSRPARVDTFESISSDSTSCCSCLKYVLDTICCLLNSLWAACAWLWGTSDKRQAKNEKEEASVKRPVPAEAPKAPNVAVAENPLPVNRIDVAPPVTAAALTLQIDPASPATPIVQVPKSPESGASTPLHSSGPGSPISPLSRQGSLSRREDLPNSESVETKEKPVTTEDSSPTLPPAPAVLKLLSKLSDAEAVALMTGYDKEAVAQLQEAFDNAQFNAGKYLQRFMPDRGAALTIAFSNGITKNLTQTKEAALYQQKVLCPLVEAAGHTDAQAAKSAIDSAQSPNVFFNVPVKAASTVSSQLPQKPALVRQVSAYNEQNLIKLQSNFEAAKKCALAAIKRGENANEIVSAFTRAILDGAEGRESRVRGTKEGNQYWTFETGQQLRDAEGLDALTAVIETMDEPKKRFQAHWPKT